MTTTRFTGSTMSPREIGLGIEKVSKELENVKGEISKIKADPELTKNIMLLVDITLEDNAATKTCIESLNLAIAKKQETEERVEAEKKATGKTIQEVCDMQKEYLTSCSNLTILKETNTMLSKEINVARKCRYSISASDEPKLPSPDAESTVTEQTVHTEKAMIDRINMFYQNCDVAIKQKNYKYARTICMKRISLVEKKILPAAPDELTIPPPMTRSDKPQDNTTCQDLEVLPLNEDVDPTRCVEAIYLYLIYADVLNSCEYGGENVPKLENTLVHCLKQAYAMANKFISDQLVRSVIASKFSIALLRVQLGKEAYNLSEKALNNVWSIVEDILNGMEVQLPASDVAFLEFDPAVILIQTARCRMARSKFKECDELLQKAEMLVQKLYPADNDRLHRIIQNRMTLYFKMGSIDKVKDLIEEVLVKLHPEFFGPIDASNVPITTLLNTKLQNKEKCPNKQIDFNSLKKPNQKLSPVYHKYIVNLHDYYIKKKQKYYAEAVMAYWNAMKVKK